MGERWRRKGRRTEGSRAGRQASTLRNPSALPPFLCPRLSVVRIPVSCRTVDARRVPAVGPSEGREHLVERREALCAGRATRCERFHDVEPLAAPLCERRERLCERREHLSEHRELLCACRATRCERFHDVEPLAAPPSECRERLLEHRESLHACRASRCERFHDVEPLAAPLFEYRERLFEHRELLSACRASRWERFHDVEPLAAPLSECRERLSEFRERLFEHRASSSITESVPRRRTSCSAALRIPRASLRTPRASLRAPSDVSKTRASLRTPNLFEHRERLFEHRESLYVCGECLLGMPSVTPRESGWAEANRTPLLPSPCGSGASTAPAGGVRRAGGARRGARRFLPKYWDGGTQGRVGRRPVPPSRVLVLGSGSVIQLRERSNRSAEGRKGGGRDRERRGSQTRNPLPHAEPSVVLFSLVAAA